MAVRATFAQILHAVRSSNLSMKQSCGAQILDSVSTQKMCRDQRYEHHGRSSFRLLLSARPGLAVTNSNESVVKLHLTRCCERARLSCCCEHTCLSV